MERKLFLGGIVLALCACSSFTMADSSGPVLLLDDTDGAVGPSASVSGATPRGGDGCIWDNGPVDIVPATNVGAGTQQDFTVPFFAQVADDFFNRLGGACARRRKRKGLRRGADRDCRDPGNPPDAGFDRARAARAIHALDLETQCFGHCFHPLAPN